jgi:membrane AbrB-like protein
MDDRPPKIPDKAGMMGKWGKAAAEDCALLAVAGAGGFALHSVGVPAGWLTGAMAAAALSGFVRPWRGPSEPVVTIGMVLSGAIIGAAATPEALAAAARYPGSLAFLLLSLVLTVALTGAFLARFGGWSRLDALLAAAPGALSAVMAVAREATDGLARISIIQMFRLFMLIAAAPSLLVAAGVGAQQAGFAIQPPSWGDAAIMLAAGGLVGLGFWRIGIVAPFILGSTLASVVLHGADLVKGALPTPLAIIAFVVLGGMIGARIGAMRPRAIMGLLPLAVGAFLISTAVGALMAWPAALVAGVGYGAAFVAFAPGGLEAMALLAVVLGLDPLYVGAHHLVRFLAVGLLLPLAVRRLIKSSPPVSGAKDA